MSNSFRFLICTIALHTSALWCMTSNHHELSWSSMPSDITQEICTALLHQRVYAPAAAENVRSFLAVNKQMSSYQRQITQQILPILAASTRLHPLLAQACLMTRTDWVTSRNHEIKTAEYIHIKADSNERLIDSEQTCNQVEATLAGLIDHAHKMVLLCPYARYKALYGYLNTKYNKWNDSAAVIIRDDGTPLVVAPHVLKCNTCYTINNAHCIVKYYKYPSMCEIRSYIKDGNEDCLFKSYSMASDYKLKDIYYSHKTMLLVAPDSGQKSFIVICTNPKAIYDTLYYWTSASRMEDPMFAPVEKTTVSFEGIATKLSYDDATQEIVAFDDKGERLFCQKIDQLQYDAEPPTNE